MAVNTNPIVIKFSNEKARVFADALCQTIASAQALVDDWNANSLGTLITNNADTVADGSDTDGRYPSTHQKLLAIKTLADSVVSFGSTGTPSRYQQLLTFAVNRAPRF